jgi:ribosomal protein S18 acetylase RimI-like enzyme
MVTQLNLFTRTANASDKQQLANLIHFETQVHRHLDWRPPLDWIGNKPYLVTEVGKRLVASLACPADPPEVAWIRLFAVSAEIELSDAWQSLWPLAKEQLTELGEVTVAAIPLHDWFRKLLQASDFELTHRVIMLLWERGNSPPDGRPALATVRPMNFDDLAGVERVDQAAFNPTWRNSRESLELAFRQSAVATVAEVDGRITGYQISTANHMGGHLARLATHPTFQGRGIAYSLLRDLLAQFERRGARQITVNTQNDNHISIALYEKAGFRRTGEAYPVYQHELA